MYNPVLAWNFCAELNLFMCTSFRVFSVNFEGTNCPLGRFFFKDNFNYSAGLVQWRGLAQSLCTII